VVRSVYQICSFTTSGPPGPALLPANRPLTIQVQFHQFNIRGHYEDRVELVFFDISRNLRFTIVRSVQAIVGVKADQELLGPTAPYVRPETKPRDPEGEVIPGVPPDALAAITWKVSLPRYPVPDKISEAVMMGSTEQRIKRARQTLLPQSFSCQTYARHWHTLLHIEEEQLK
jgi:helicase MOV-10